MVKSTSRRAKRQIRWCYRSMDRALEHLQGLQEVFEPSHPDYAEFLGLIAVAQVQVQAQLSEFYRLAWGKAPSNWYTDT